MPGFQWLLDPDHNPATDDAPDVVDDSWTMSAAATSQFQPDLAACAPPGSCRSSPRATPGRQPGTNLSPADNPEAFAVGGTDVGDAIDPGSSRGPSDLRPGRRSRSSWRPA